MQLILGSQSPRRKEILQFFNLPFKQMTPPFVEEQIIFKNNPIDYAKALSEGKALSLSNSLPDALILAADTVVYQEGKNFLKPSSNQEAEEFLMQLSGKWHSVFTSLTTQYGKKSYTEVEETRVLFNEVTRKEIVQYCKAFSTLDKAGGYAIQQAGSLIIKRIEGCYYNVMGLPLNALRKVLQEFGIDLWNYL